MMELLRREKNIEKKLVLNNVLFLIAFLHSIPKTIFFVKNFFFSMYEHPSYVEN